MIDFDECVSLGLLKRIPPSRKQAEEQLKKAVVFLQEAEKALELKLPNSAVISAYSAMLNAARAILFLDGYREKSHACAVRFLEAKHAKEIGISAINLFDEYRDRRHKTIYSSDYYPTEDEVKRFVSFARQFVGKTEKILGKN